MCVCVRVCACACVHVCMCVCVSLLNAISSEKFEKMQFDSNGKYKKGFKSTLS